MSEDRVKERIKTLADSLSAKEDALIEQLEEVNSGIATKLAFDFGSLNGILKLKAELMLEAHEFPKALQVMENAAEVLNLGLEACFAFHLTDEESKSTAVSTILQRLEEVRTRCPNCNGHCDQDIKA